MEDARGRDGEIDLTQMMAWRLVVGGLMVGGPGGGWERLSSNGIVVGRMEDPRGGDGQIDLTK